MAFKYLKRIIPEEQLESMLMAKINKSRKTTKRITTMRKSILSMPQIKDELILNNKKNKNNEIEIEKKYNNNYTQTEPNICLNYENGNDSQNFDEIKEKENLKKQDVFWNFTKIKNFMKDKNMSKNIKSNSLNDIMKKNKPLKSEKNNLKKKMRSQYISTLNNMSEIRKDDPNEVYKQPIPLDMINKFVGLDSRIQEEKLNLLKLNMEEEYNKKKKEMEEELKRQEEEYISQIKELTETTEKKK